MKINEELIYTGENFNLVADTAENTVRAFEIAKKILDDGNYAGDLDLFEGDNKIAVIEGEIGNCNSAVTEICKAVAQAIPDGSFYGHAFYDDDDYGYESCADYQYENGVLTVTTTESENGHGYCPECGEQIVCFDEFDPEKKYSCEDCDCDLSAEDMFDGVLPKITTHVFKIS